MSRPIERRKDAIPFGCKRTPLGAVKRTDLERGQGRKRGDQPQGPAGVEVSSDGDLCQCSDSGGVEERSIGFYPRNFTLLVCCWALLAPQEG